jgi:hypothetical protein
LHWNQPAYLWGFTHYFYLLGFDQIEQTAEEPCSMDVAGAPWRQGRRIPHGSCFFPAAPEAFGETHSELPSIEVAWPTAPGTQGGDGIVFTGETGRAA